MNPVYSKLPDKHLGNLDEAMKRLLLFDPATVYGNISPDVNKRVQSVSLTNMFPKNGAKCGCGCGRGLSGRKTRWATDDCSRFAVAVHSIITGRVDAIRLYLSLYYGYNCIQCGTTKDLKLDHIVPVKHGGGGCWLSNFQFLCHSCHVGKTNNDFGWKKKTLLPELF